MITTAPSEHTSPPPPSFSSSAFIHLLTPDILRKARRPNRRKEVIVVDSTHTLKFGPASHYSSYEYRVLQLLERLGPLPLPCPRPIDLFTIPVLPSGEIGQGGEEYNVMVMSTIPGRELAWLSRRMTSAERVKIFVELRGFIEGLNEAMVRSGDYERVNTPRSSRSGWRPMSSVPLVGWIHRWSDRVILIRLEDERSNASNT